MIGQPEATLVRERAAIGSGPENNSHTPGAIDWAMLPRDRPVGWTGTVWFTTITA